MPRHKLNNKANWIKLAVGIALTIAGIITQFDVTVNQNKTVLASVSNPEAYPAIKRAYITEAACRGIKKDTKVADLQDRFKVRGDTILATRMPLAEDHKRDCVAYDDARGEIEHVSLDLMVDY